MEQSRKLLVAILVSSLVTNVILLSITGASLAMVYKLNKQVDEVHQRLEEVRKVVDTLKAARETVKERMQQRRQGAAEEEGNPNEGEEPKTAPRRPLQRLRGGN